MAKLYISEFAGLRHRFHPIQVPSAPPVVEQTPVVIGGGSLQSAAFSASTHLIGLSADAICSVSVGGANPSATINNFRLPADTIVYFGVVPGDKVAVIANT